MNFTELSLLFCKFNMYICKKEFYKTMCATEMREVSAFGAWLQSRRKAKGWSLRLLVERSGEVCKPQYLSQIENGLRGKNGLFIRPSENIVAILAETLGESVNEVLNIAGYNAQSIKFRERVLTEFSDALHNYHNLSENSRKFAKKHFVETIEFLLELDGSNNDTKQDKKTSENTGKQPNFVREAERIKPVNKNK